MKRSNLTPLDFGAGLVSTVRVARLLGVGISTVKRWVDSGIIPAILTPGGHRKLLLKDVLRLSKAGTLPVLAHSEILPHSPEELRLELESAIRTNDVESICGLITGAHCRGYSVGVLADAVIAPAMRRLGSDWAAGRATVAGEHRVTQAVVSAVYGLNGRIETTQERGRPVALGCAPEYDHYLLPTLLARMTLVEAGWNAVNVGPNTPFTALLASVDELQPKLVWLSVSHLADPARFVEEYDGFYRAVEKRGIAIAIGGQALTQELRSRLTYTFFGDGCVQLAAFTKMLQARRQIPKRGRPVGSGKKRN